MNVRVLAWMFWVLGAVALALAFWIWKMEILIEGSGTGVQ